MYVKCICTQSSIFFQIYFTVSRFFCIALARIEQRHVKHNNIHTLFGSQVLPLFNYLPIVSAEPVDGLHKERVPAAKPAQQLFVLRAVKIPSALLVRKYIFRPNSRVAHCRKLPRFVLFPA